MALAACSERTPTQAVVPKYVPAPPPVALSEAQVAQRAALQALTAPAGGVKPRFLPTPGYVLIPAGTFTMGIPPADVDPPGYYNDAPTHRVTLTHSFEMQATEVTEAEYARLMPATPSQRTGCPDCPVTNVNWHQAVTYCNQLSKRAQLPPCYVVMGFDVTYAGASCPGYRLPSEAEWEYAARAGTNARRWDSAANVYDLAWIDTNSGDLSLQPPQLVKHPVRRKRPNPFGLYDMLGNVWEWVWDWQGDYPAAASADPRGPDKGENRGFRGGSFKHSESEATAGFRNGYGPGNQVEFVGMRCVRSVTR
ncbi:MAG: formylglycine-generating enzyme family protein [Myxococcales bacterium]|nr:formylglycine-generating enzyme family protein [Myxococcales bacterium]